MQVLAQQINGTRGVSESCAQVQTLPHPRAVVIKTCKLCVDRNVLLIIWYCMYVRRKTTKQNTYGFKLVFVASTKAL